jgi:hypothetical protein
VKLRKYYTRYVSCSFNFHHFLHLSIALFNIYLNETFTVNAPKLSDTLSDPDKQILHNAIPLCVCSLHVDCHNRTCVSICACIICDKQCTFQHQQSQEKQVLLLVNIVKEDSTQGLIDSDQVQEHIRLSAATQYTYMKSLQVFTSHLCYVVSIMHAYFEWFHIIVALYLFFK